MGLELCDHDPTNKAHIKDVHVNLQKLNFIIRREWKFYIFRVVIVLSIVSFFATFVFLFGETGNLADRLGFVATMLLTTVAFMFIVKEYLPTLPYLTLLDKYVYFSLVFVLAVGVESCIESPLVRYEVLDGNDLILFFVNLTVWASVHVWFVIVCVAAHKRESKKLTMLKIESDSLRKSIDKGLTVEIHRPNVKYDLEKEFSYGEKVFRSYFAFKKD